MHIPVIFHNLSDYDSHIIMKGIGAMECPDDIEPIPYNMEKYMAFKLGSLRFLDSMQFMKSGLDKLASNLGARVAKRLFAKMEANSLALNLVIYSVSIVVDVLLTQKISRLLASMSYQNCLKYISRKVCTHMSL